MTFVSTQQYQPVLQELQCLKENFVALEQEIQCILGVLQQITIKKQQQQHGELTLRVQQHEELTLRVQ